MSWERSRSIPWDRIKQDVEDPDAHKALVIRDLQREAIQDEPETDGISGSSGIKSVAFSTGDLLKQAAFGACIGGITGAVFGFMDGMRTAGESSVLQRASNVAKGKYLLQGTTRSATLFGVFFSGFHLVKYGLKVAFDPGEFTQIGVAGAVSMGALVAKPSWRPSIPYAGMLIVMDSFQIIMKEFEK